MQKRLIPHKRMSVCRAHNEGVLSKKVLVLVLEASGEHPAVIREHDMETELTEP